MGNWDTSNEKRHISTMKSHNGYSRLKMLKNYRSSFIQRYNKKGLNATEIMDYVEQEIASAEKVGK